MFLRPLLLASLLTAFAAACSAPGPGASCDPMNSGACRMGLVCSPRMGSNVCLIPYGGACDMMASDSYCVEGAHCIAVPNRAPDGGTDGGTSGACYLPEGATCDPHADTAQCDPALTCAEHMDGSFKCRRPVLFRGHVSSSMGNTPIGGALVLGLDVQPVAVTDVAVSNSDGTYELRVPVVRNNDGAPTAATFTLRGSANGYDTFPGGIRTALPISTTLAMDMPAGYVVSGTLTDIVLIPVQNAGTPRVSISGHVLAQANSNGVLVVANGGDHGLSAISDAHGAYTIFNVPAGMYEVRGYKAGVQLVPAMVTAASSDLTGVDLATGGGPLSMISGSLQVVNPGSCAMTSIVLAVESTFNEALGRGEFPFGLRAPPPPMAPSIANAAMWTISNIPDGRYVVLAGFENDNCVRDPDTGIGGTATVHVALPANAGTLSQTFKVTGALATLGPGVMEPEAVTAAPTLRWQDDSGEADYLVEVFDAYGNLAWMTTHPGVSGSSMVSEPYAGPLMPGMYYQFRATSRNNMHTPLSRTEDLRGVFYMH